MSDIIILNKIDKLPMKFIDVKNFLRVNDDHDDEIIKLCYMTAIETAEKYLNFYILPVKIEYSVILKNYSLIIHHLPINNIDKITYCQHNDYIEMPDNEYVLLKDNIIKFKNKLLSNKIKVYFTAGYLDESKIPKLIMKGILYHTAELYDNQTSTTLLSEKLKAFYSPYKYYRL